MQSGRRLRRIPLAAALLVTYLQEPTAKPAAVPPPPAAHRRNDETHLRKEGIVCKARRGDPTMGCIRLSEVALGLGLICWSKSSGF